MKTAGLKADFILTLLLLLSLSALLADLVITMFWQQSVLRMETDRIRTILEAEAVRLATRPSPPDNAVRNELEKVRSAAGATCLAILRHDEYVHSGSSCPHQDALLRALRKSRELQRPIMEPFGSTWGLFMFRPEFLVAAVPVQQGGGTAGIGTVTSLKPLYAALRAHQKAIFVYLLVNVLVLATVGFFRLVRSTVKPVEQLVRLTENYDAQYDIVPFYDQGGSEFGRLSMALNRMTRRIDADRQRLRETVESLEAANSRLRKAQQEMIRAEKLASVGRLSAGLAHEIGNPIGIIQGYLELLRRDNLSPEDRTEFSERAVRELERINRLIRQLLDFARTPPPDRQKIRINPLLHDMVEMFSKRRNMENINFQISTDARNDMVMADEEGMRQVFLNCLLNAVDAIAEKTGDAQGKISVTTANRQNEESPAELVIAIRDNGPGIDPSDLNNIFDPFFTTKEPGKGTGLGLSVSHAIIQASGGTISARSEKGQGAEITIALPVAEGFADANVNGSGCEVRGSRF